MGSLLGLVIGIIIIFATTTHVLCGLRSQSGSSSGTIVVRDGTDHSNRRDGIVGCGHEVSIIQGTTICGRSGKSITTTTTSSNTSDCCVTPSRITQWTGCHVGGGSIRRYCCRGQYVLWSHGSDNQHGCSHQYPFVLCEPPRRRTDECGSAVVQIGRGGQDTLIPAIITSVSSHDTKFR